MNEHRGETLSLTQAGLSDDAEECRQLAKRIAQIQRDGRCVQRAASVTALFAALAVAGLAYGAILQENVFYIGSHFVIRVLCELGLAALICLLVFAGLLTGYGRKLRRLRRDYLRSITNRRQSHPGIPQVEILRYRHPGSGDPELAPRAAEISGSPGHLG